MAVATAVALVGLGLSVYQTVEAKRRQDEAEEAAEVAAANLRTDIMAGVPNMMEGLQLPTKGIELEEAAMARAVGSGVDAAQQAGAAGVIGGVGRITQAAGEQSAQQAARIEKTEFARDKLVAEQDQKAELLKYQGLIGLGTAQLTGSSQAAADAYKAQQEGMANIGQSVGSLAGSVDSNPYGGEIDPKITDTSSTSDPYAGITGNSVTHTGNQGGGSGISSTLCGVGYTWDSTQGQCIKI